MDNYVPLYVRIWSDNKFKVLSIEARLLFLYLIANHRINLTGIYEIDLEVCKAESRVNGFNGAFAEIEKSSLMAYDISSNFIWIRNRFKLLPNHSTKVIVGAIEELNKNETIFKNPFIERYKKILQPHLYKLHGYQVNQEELLSEEQIGYIAKLYNSKQSIKKFLINKGINEGRIDEVINRVLPNLKP